MKILWALLPVAAVVGVVAGNRPDVDRQLQVVGGKTTISLYSSILETNKIRVQYSSTAEGDQNSAEPSTGFRIANSDLRFSLVDGRLKRIESGSMSHQGGFTLSAGGKTVNANGFALTASRTVGDALQLTVGGGRTASSPFDLTSARTYYLAGPKQLAVTFMDITLNSTGAQQLGRPDLSGLALGFISVYAEAEPIDGRGDIEVPAPLVYREGEDAAVDVSLSAMSSLSSAGRIGTFPNGRNGLTMSTTSCNVGTSNIPWFEPMDTRHPAIAMNLYRLNAGRLEQIGWSWMKHGFFATNSAGCGSCSSPGTGTLLGTNCSDTYGTGNNSDRKYLGARDEMNAFTGIWTCQGSYFSNGVNDCVRRNSGSGLDSVAHRLEVTDADMNFPNAQYFYEAYYVNGGDFDRYNNCGSRQVTIAWNGASWQFTNHLPQVQGPVINRWGEMRSTAQPRTDGDVIVAVQTTDLGGGMWRYEYAVYNHDSDRQVREFSIPMPAGFTVQNIGFHDIDQDATNQWAGTYASGKVSWSTGAFGTAGANPLKFSSLFNFRFDANVAPGDGSAKLGLFKPGTLTELDAATKTPKPFLGITSFTMVNGFSDGGTVASMNVSDDGAFQMGRTQADGVRDATGIIGSITAPAGTINSLVLRAEVSNNLPATVNTVQTIHLWNWTTSAYELMDTRPATPTDSVATITVPSSAGRFVNSGTREVRVRIVHTTPPGTHNRWRMAFDQVAFQFN